MFSKNKSFKKILACVTIVILLLLITSEKYPFSKTNTRSYSAKISDQISTSDNLDFRKDHINKKEKEACINSNEIEIFDKPKPISWEAQFNGCLTSCSQGHFTKIKLSENDKYPRFEGLYNGGQSQYTDISDKFMEHGLKLRIIGDWVAVDSDYANTVFDGKCVPIVEIKKIEVI